MLTPEQKELTDAEVEKLLRDNLWPEKRCGNCECWPIKNSDPDRYDAKCNNRLSPKSGKFTSENDTCEYHVDKED